MEGEGQRDGTQQVAVLPGRHRQEGLVLGDTVDGVQHLDGHKDGEGHGHGMGVTEYLTVKSWEVRIVGMMKYKLYRNIGSGYLDILTN